MGDERELSHLNEAGEVHMVDVGDKPVTDREAVAEGFVVMSPDLAERFFSGDLPKGDAAAVARVAGIMAAKTDRRADPSVPSHPADRRRGRARAEWAWNQSRC